MSSSNKPIVSQWDGMPRPGLTFRSLVQGLLRTGSTRGVAALRWLAVLSNQRAWLAWLCGVGALAALALSVGVVYWVITGALAPLLMSLSHVLVPLGAPWWWQLGCGAVMAVLALIVLCLMFAAYVSFPARLWVAFSVLMNEDEPESGRVGAGDWLQTSAIGWAFVVVGLTVGLAQGATHARDWATQAKNAQAQWVAAMDSQDKGLAFNGDPRKPTWPDIAHEVDRQLDAVNQGKTDAFDVQALEHTQWSLQSPTLQVALEKVSDRTRSDVLQDPLLIPTTLLVTGLSARLDRDAHAAEIEHTQALARGDQAGAKKVIQGLELQRARYNRALLGLEAKELGSVALASALILAGGNNQWFDDRSDGDYLDGYAILDSSGYIRNSSGQLIPSQDNKMGYGCAPLVYSDQTEVPTLSSPEEIQDAQSVANRIEQIGGWASSCEMGRASSPTLEMWSQVLQQPKLRQAIKLPQ